jgi:transposase-like protein
VEELLVECGVEVDHVTVFRWVQRSRRCWPVQPGFARHVPGDRWFVDETYVKVNGVGRYVYRAIDQHGPDHRRAGLGPPGRGHSPSALPTGAVNV